MHIHILGICGTFMGGIAAIAKEAGHTVSGCDQNIYPPMNEQLEKLGINLINGYDAEQINLNPDIFLIGNGISRGNPLLEAILDGDYAYTSAPQWLYENVLRNRHVIAIAGTHGKTTTTAYTTFIINSHLQATNQAPAGYLIGGVSQDFPFSANLGEKYFVIEADEYDTAFFDKRSKFIHYHPKTLILNNLEFDHADIFENLSAIKTQFHHLVRSLSCSAKIIANHTYPAIVDVIKQGVFSKLSWFNDENWKIINKNNSFYIRHKTNTDYENLLISDNIIGAHNRENLLAAVIACEDIGINPKQSLDYMKKFSGVRRRLELLSTVRDIKIYDDFAHHPSAISASISALRELIGNSKRIITVVEPRSNTMKMGVFAEELPKSLMGADVVFGYDKNLGWDLNKTLQTIGGKSFADINMLIDEVIKTTKSGDVIIGMSNGGFDGFYDKLIMKLTQ